MRGCALAVQKLLHATEELAELAGCVNLEEVCTEASALICPRRAGPVKGVGERFRPPRDPPCETSRVALQRARPLLALTHGGDAQRLLGTDRRPCPCPTPPHRLASSRSLSSAHPCARARADPVEVSDADEYLRVTESYFLHVRYHGLLWRGASANKPTSIRDVNVTLAEQLSVLEWYDANSGLREVLVRVSAAYQGTPTSGNRAAHERGLLLRALRGVRAPPPHRPPRRRRCSRSCGSGG
eukprot:7391429-Prymnesium_polylepis.4